jgi:hypothetical protein
MCSRQRVTEKRHLFIDRDSTNGLVSHEQGQLSFHGGLKRKKEIKCTVSLLTLVGLLSDRYSSFFIGLLHASDLKAENVRERERQRKRERKRERERERESMSIPNIGAGKAADVAQNNNVRSRVGCCCCCKERDWTKNIKRERGPIMLLLSRKHV